MATELELKKRGRMGFSEEDYVEWLRRRVERREDIQAHEMALEKLRETGLGGRLEREEVGRGERLGVTEAGRLKRLGIEEAGAGRRLGIEEAGREKRLGVKETGLGKRLGKRLEVTEAGSMRRLEKELVFRRPEQAARIGEIKAKTIGAGVTTAREEYGLEFEKGLEDTLKDIVGQQKTLGKLDIDVLRRQLPGPRVAPAEAAPDVAKPRPVAPAEAAKPGRRKVRPSVQRFLYGTPTKKIPGVIPGLLSPLTGLINIGEWLKGFAKKGYEYAYPKVK